MSRSKNKRKKASKFLKLLLKMYDHKCFWCNEEISSRDELPSGFYCSERFNGYYWCFSVTGEVRKFLVASVDHLIPVSKGGSDKLKNLVPACELCNSKRGNKTDGKYAFVVVRRQN